MSRQLYHDHDDAPLPVNGAGVLLDHSPEHGVPSAAEVVDARARYFHIMFARQENFDDPFSDTPSPAEPYTEAQEKEALLTYERLREDLRAYEVRNAVRLREEQHARWLLEHQFDIAGGNRLAVTVTTTAGTVNCEMTQLVGQLVRHVQMAVGDEWRGSCGETFIESLLGSLEGK